MKYFIVILLSLFSLSVISQNADKNIQEIIRLKKKNIKFQRQIINEKTKSKEFYHLAVANTQSAKLMISNVEPGTPTEEKEKEFANSLSDKATLYSFRSDSCASIVLRLQDSIKLNIEEINRLAKNINISQKDTILTSHITEVKADVKPKLKAEEKTVVETPVLKIEEKNIPATDKLYTVQLKADKTGTEKINVPDVRIIKCSDGYYRYVTGEYLSKKEALKLQRQLAEKGYKDCFVRNLNSIN